MASNPATEILKVQNLVKTFRVKKGHIFARETGVIKAVDNVSLSVRKGESLGLVGESGCGKTTTGRLIAGLIKADDGKVIFEGQNLLTLDSAKFKSMRRKIQMVFQDPLSSLNPRMPVGEIIVEPLIVHKLEKKKEALRERAVAALEEVGLNSSFINRYPHQLSGGQRQRVLIARALILSPTFIIADEPVSALDVSVQADVLNLLNSFRKEKDFSSLFISHDLAVVRYVCSAAAVMYFGSIVEKGPIEELFDSPLHPYTQDLINSVPDVKRRNFGKLIPGKVPDPFNPPTGCPYHPRCRKAEKICREEKPACEEKSPGRFAACHLV